MSTDSARDKLVDEFSSVLSEAESLLDKASKETGDTRTRPALASRGPPAVGQAQAAGARRRGRRPRQGGRPLHGRLRARPSVAGDRHRGRRRPRDRLADEPPLEATGRRETADGGRRRRERGETLRGALAARRCAARARCARGSSSSSVEYTEERGRITRQLALLLAGLGCLLFALFFVAGAVIVYFWDYAIAIAAIIGVIVFFVAPAQALLWRRAELSSTSPDRRFAATMAELEKDRAADRANDERWPTDRMTLRGGRPERELPRSAKRGG